MRTALTFFTYFMFILLAGCVSQDAQLQSMRTNTVMLTVGTPNLPFTQIALFGKDVNGSHTFAKFFVSTPGQLELELVPSGWTFYAISYNGAVLSECSVVVVNNQKTRKFSSMSFSNSACAHEDLLGPDPGLNQSILPSVSWSSVRLEFCETVDEITNENQFCTDLLSDGSRLTGRGNNGSFRYTLMEYERSGSSVVVTGAGVASACQLGYNTNPGSLQGTSTTSMTAYLPSGDGSTTPFYVKLELFPDDSCAKTAKVINLYNGIVKDDSFAQYVTLPGAPARRKLFLKYDGDDVCQGTQLLDTFAGGTGTLERPYLICNQPQLYNIFPAVPANYVTMARAHYKLQKDIDLTGVSVGAGGTLHPVWETCVTAGSNFMPIGFSSTCVITLINAGSFDGGGNTIKGLKIGTAVNSTGFYSEVFGNALEIRRLTLENSQVTGLDFTGSFLGVGYNLKLTQLRLINSSVAGTSALGGIVGGMQGGSIRKSQVTGSTITGTGEVGGLAGRGIYSGTAMTNLYDNLVEANVTTTGTTAGGLVGLLGSLGNYGEILGSRFIGNVTARSDAGGLVGIGNSLRIENSYARAKVTTTAAGAARQGGLIGAHLNKLAGTGIFTSYYYPYLGMDLGWSCLLGTACKIGNIVGDTGNYLTGDYPSAVYPNTLSTVGFNTVFVGQPQTDASFTLYYPGWVDSGAVDITPLFDPILFWKFENGSLPEFQSE